MFLIYLRIHVENAVYDCAVQCWTAIQNLYGCASCTAMSMLGETLIPSACEADIAGAIEIFNLDVLGASLSPERSFGGIKGKVLTHLYSFDFAL
jgi:L-fucose isomerase-like protein